MKETIKIGTRGSKLALYQANYVKELLLAKYDIASKFNIEIVKIKTTGDIFKTQPLSEIGGKSLFTKEIEDELNKENIDLAVHSLKDFTGKTPDNLIISSFLPRIAPSDSLVSEKYKSIAELPKNAIIGTSSCRRKYQLKHLRPDLNIVPLRGNIDTRITNLLNNKFDAIFLATAGLLRLSIDINIYTPINLDDILPAPGQGTICIQSRINDQKIFNIVRTINCRKTEIESLMEREFVLALNANCNTPVAAYASANKNKIAFKSEVYSESSNKKSTCFDECSENNIVEIARKCADKLRDKLI